MCSCSADMGIIRKNENDLSIEKNAELLIEEEQNEELYNLWKHEIEKEM
jgi:hypothetical protein